MMISKLGQERYGVWIFLQSFTGYYGLLDMGLRAGITQSVTRRIGKGDRVALVSFISGIMPLVMKTACAVFCVVTLVGFLLMAMLHLTVITRGETFGIVFLQAIAWALTILLFPFESVLPASNRNDIAVGIAICCRIVSAWVLWSFLQVSNNLLVLCLIYFSINLFEQLLRCFTAVLLVPELKNVQPRSDSKEVSELYRVGGWGFVFQVSHNILLTFNAVLAGYWFSVSSLVPYNLACSFSDYLNKVTVLASRVLFPEFVRVKHLFGVQNTRSLFHLSTRLALAVSCMALVGGWYWFDSFLSIWLWNVEGNQQIIPVAKSIFIVFAFLNCIGSVRAIGFQLLGSEDQMEFLGKATLREAGISIPFAILFGSTFGVVGLPLGNLLVLSLSTFFYLVPKYASLLDESGAQFLQNVLLRPLTYGALAFVLVGIWARQVETIENWTDLFVKGIIPTLGIFGALLPILLTSSEISKIRGRFRVSPLLEGAE
ncbi:MAG: lipopolysaccharide biosynthesis protein [Planctomycetota bacterium]